MCLRNPHRKAQSPQRSFSARYRRAIEVYRRIATLVVLTTVGASLLQCSPTPPPQQTSSSPPSPSVPTTTRSTPTPPLAPAAARPVTADELGATWRPGCPVGPERLRVVELNYVGFDGQTHRGELIVHQDLVADVIAIFDQLHRQRYPSPRCATSTTTRMPKTNCRWRTTTPRRSIAGRCRRAGRGRCTPMVARST